MKRIVTAIVAVAMLGAGSASGAAESAQAAPWDEQMRGMIYLIMNLSSINAINGINLTREQAVKLRALAAEVEQVSPKVPDMTLTYRPDLGEVRKTYVETRQLLLKGEAVPSSLEMRVGAARLLETAVVRASLGKPTIGTQGCAKCHGQPDAPDLRSGGGMAAMQKRLITQADRTQGFYAHAVSLAGSKGLGHMIAAVPKLKQILSIEQLDAMSSFSCCLTPPKSMTDPVRAGQAASNEGEQAILRYVRGVDEKSWQTAKAGAKSLVNLAIVALDPSATEARKEAVWKQVEQIAERARKMSETDFELEKDKLAGELRDAIHETSTSGSKGAKQAAPWIAGLFLLEPGTVEAYDALIKRLDAKK